jgi:hypothetical protein
MESEVNLSVSNILRTLAPVFLVLFCAFSPAISLAGLIWDPVGSALSDSSFNPFGSDGVQTVNLGSQFAFPFEGDTVQSISVATSGIIWLNGANTSQCCILSSGPTTSEQAFDQGPPRIAPGWADLRPDLGGSVDVNQISDADGTRTVVTYQNVPTNPSDLSQTVSFQVQLYTSGEIIFSYLQFNGTSLGSNFATVLGLTPGVGSSPDTIVDFTTLQSVGPVTSVFDYAQLSPGFSLSGDSFIFTPIQGTDSFQLSAAASPEPSTLLPIAGIFFFFAVILTRQKRIPKY